jgi:ribonuclease D
MADLPEQIVTRPEELIEACEHLAQHARFGFDTEFVGEETYHPRLCLVQAATEERLYLIDPLSVGPLDIFWNLVVDPANLVIVHAGREEIRLCKLWTGRVPGNLFDLQIAAGLVGLAYPLGHGTLVNQVLGGYVAKGETLTEWRDRPLSPKQIRYAFDDVRHLLPLWRRLSERLTERGRVEWAREEFSRLAAVVTAVGTSDERWRKLRGVGSLDRRGLAIVRELNRWRDEAAEQTNRPVRSIVRDDLLIEIARRNPSREGDLRVIRGLPRRFVSSLLEVVRSAQSIPLEECPAVLEREQDPPQAPMLTSALSAVLGNLCARMNLAPNLVANNQDIRLLVRAHLQNTRMPVESPLAIGWRSRSILPELLAFLQGRNSLRVADAMSAAPFSLTPEEPGDHWPPEV